MRQLKSDIQSQSVTGANLTDKIHDCCAVLLATTGQSNPLQQANVADPTKSKFPPGSCDRCGRNDCVPGGCCRNTDIHGKPLDKSTKTELGRKIGREQYNRNKPVQPKSPDPSQANLSSPAPAEGECAMADAKPQSEIDELVHIMLGKVKEDNKYRAPYVCMLCYLLYYAKGSTQLSRRMRAVIDSGSGLHITPHVTVQDRKIRFNVSGFNGSKSLTDGAGELAFCVRDTSGNPSRMSLTGAQRFDGPKTLFSLGLLLREGYRFRLEGPTDNIMIMPCGTSIPLSLGEDNILALDCEPWAECHYGARREMHTATRKHLHGILNHCCHRKLLETLKHTVGCELVGPKGDEFCETCARAKVSRVGISRREAHVVEEAHVLSVHEVRPTDLRPYEHMYVDNKSYPGPVRGSRRECLVFVDKAGFGIHVRDVHSKAENGKAFRQIITSLGIDKLPYKCTVFADNCGSMKHVEEAVENIAFEPLPPKDHELNLAEKAIDIIFHAANALLIHSGRHTKYFNLAVQHACYTHMRMATSASRNWITPYEYYKGEQPNISPSTRTHLRRELSTREVGENTIPALGKRAGIHPGSERTVRFLPSRARLGGPCLRRRHTCRRKGGRHPMVL